MKESSMSAADTNVHFREHDIEFLQKRTKLWLETVLGETYGDRTLPELISDGNLLYRVSKHITREMTGTSPRPQEISPKTLAHLDSKNSGKYLPYANVDTFLKACRKVGLTDIELFSPPDAVEGKDIRQVCTSIRSLAKKARAQQIRVPDFEDVNRPLPMPKEKVEEIKGTLQHSHSSPISPTVVPPEADIKKSERVQIISRFLSSTTNPLYVPEDNKGSKHPSEPLSPVTPGPLKSLSMKNSPFSTPTATVGGIDTPHLTKSVSNIGPSPVPAKSLKESFVSSAQPISSDESKPDGAQITPSPELPVDEPSDFPLFSQKALGSFRHAQPHFIKKPSSAANQSDDVPNLAKDLPVEGSLTHPEPEKTPSSSSAVSAPSTPDVPQPSSRAVSTPSTPAVSSPSTPAVSTMPGISSDLLVDRSSTPSTPAVSKPSTPAVSSDHKADRSTPLTPAVSNPSTPAVSSGHQSDRSSTPSTPAVSSDHQSDRLTTSTPAVPKPSTPAVSSDSSTPSTPAVPKPSTPAVSSDSSTPSTPAVPKPSTPAVAPDSSTPSTPAVPKPSTPAVAPDRSTPSTPAVSKPSTPAVSSDHQAKELPTLTQLGLGAYRHAHPHFSFKKSSQADVTDSQDLQPETSSSTPRAPNGKPKAPSSNKIIENDPRRKLQQTEVRGRNSFGPAATKASQGSSAPAKEPASQPEAKVFGIQLNRRLWVPLAAGALAFVGTLLVVRPREPSVYEVREGDTLSKISKRIGKESWDELVNLNPGILNPNLIYPSERLRLPSK